MLAAGRQAGKLPLDLCLAVLHRPPGMTTRLLARKVALDALNRQGGSISSWFRLRVGRAGSLASERTARCGGATKLVDESHKDGLSGKYRIIFRLQ